MGTRKLGVKSAHREAMLANLVNSLIVHGRIETTVTRAKEARSVAEKMITLAKKGSPHNRRQAFRTLRNKEAVHTLFEEVGPKFTERQGGYTRVLKLGPRRGDGAPMAVLELVE